MSRTAVGLYTERVPRFRRYGAAREFVTLSMGFTGLISPVGGAGAQGYFQMNGMLLTPLTNINNFLGANNPGSALSGGTLINQNFPGYTSLVNMYAGARIHRCGVSVTCTPTLAADNLTLGLMPFTAGAPALTNFFQQEIAGQSYGKIMQCYGGVPNTLKKSLHPADICGLTRMQWAAQLPFNPTTNPVANYQTYWLVRWSTNDAAVIVGNVNFTITISVDVEFSNPVNQVV